MTRHSRAFTLIELLVVIAIIAILAAILFPVFAQAKAAAKQSACLSNTKQISTALTMYVSDTDGVYPGYFQRSVPTSETLPDDLPLWSGLAQPYIKNGDVFFCPTAKGYKYQGIANHSVVAPTSRGLGFFRSVASHAATRVSG